MPVVVDTSVVIKWVVREAYTDNAVALRDDHLRRNDLICVPPLVIYEAANVLYDFARTGVLTMAEAEQALADVSDVVALLRFDVPLIVSGMQIADAANKKDTFDAHFLALAVHLGYPFWTADRRFARAIQKRLPTAVSELVHLIETHPV